MNKIKKLEKGLFYCDFYENKINSIAEEIAQEESKYYIDSRIIIKWHMLYLDLLISSLDNTFVDKEKEHFKKYFVQEKERVIEQILKKNLKNLI